MIVNKYFIDKTDKSEYNPGDVYPREGLTATEARIADLTAKGYISESPTKEQDDLVDQLESPTKEQEDLVDQLPDFDEGPKPSKKSKSRKNKE